MNLPYDHNQPPTTTKRCNDVGENCVSHDRSDLNESCCSLSSFLSEDHEDFLVQGDSSRRGPSPPQRNDYQGSMDSSCHSCLSNRMSSFTKNGDLQDEPVKPPQRCLSPKLLPEKSTSECENRGCVSRAEEASQPLRSSSTAKPEEINGSASSRWVHESLDTPDISPSCNVSCELKKPQDVGIAPRRPSREYNTESLVSLPPKPERKNSGGSQDAPNTDTQTPPPAPVAPPQLRFDSPMTIPRRQSSVLGLPPMDARKQPQRDGVGRTTIRSPPNETTPPHHEAMHNSLDATPSKSSTLSEIQPLRQASLH